MKDRDADANPVRDDPIVPRPAHIALTGFEARAQMASIFISYRRQDSIGHAGRLARTLKEAFGREQVFTDIDDIKPGDDFLQVLNKQLNACRVLLVLIGPNWLKAADESGRRRLDDPDDIVRMEVATSLNRKIPIIPVLFQSASPPPSSMLPVSIEPMSRQQAHEMSDSRWDYDIGRLIERI